MFPSKIEIKQKEEIKNIENYMSVGITLTTLD
jgi:hypothetical protein